MSRDMRVLTPEDRELEKKRADLRALEVKLQERELEFATLRGELAAFERRYLDVVGRRYAELDELDAAIAEVAARQRPWDTSAQRAAGAARARASESADALGIPGPATGQDEFKPSDALRTLYRQATKAMHPDLTGDEEERARRGRFMARVNSSYGAGDEHALRAILEEWQSAPEAVKGEGAGAELVRTIRKIAQVERRLDAIHVEIGRLEESELSRLMAQIDQSERGGRDLLREMAQRLDLRLSESKARLAVLSGKAGV
jgi:hypothetical protein